MCASRSLSLSPPLRKALHRPTGLKIRACWPGRAVTRRQPGEPPGGAPFGSDSGGNLMILLRLTSAVIGRYTNEEEKNNLACLERKQMVSIY